MNQYKYTVTLQLPDREAFFHFVDSIGPLVERLVVTVDGPPPTQTAEPEADAPPPPKARAPRISKVSNAINAALKDGPKTVKQLKEALEAADLSPGSLSTGIATLQRENVLERVGEGLYALSNFRQAAE